MSEPRNALEYHANGRPGKIEVVASKRLTSQRDLSLAYSPGVADACRGGVPSIDCLFVQLIASHRISRLMARSTGKTDGQIFLETDNFNSGLRPAMSPGISVSRVGGSAQVPFMKKIAGGIKLALAQYRELAAFSQFASDLDDATRRQLEHGRRVTELMKQKQYAPMSVADMGVSLYAANEGYLEDIEVDQVLEFEQGLLAYMNSEKADFMRRINETGDYDDDIVAEMRQGIEAYKAQANF